MNPGKPKIALLIDWYLPGTKAGGPVRSAYSLVNLLKSDFDFYIITSNTDLGSDQPYTAVQSDTLFEKEGVHYYYFSKKKNSSKQMLELLGEISPDLIYLNSFWSFRFSINILWLCSRKKIQTPVLLAPRGMLGSGALSLKQTKKKLFIAFAKIRGLYRGVIFHATKADEKQDILRRIKKASVFIAPNVNGSTPRMNTSTKEKGSLKLFYLSRIARVKNLHFALEALKNVPAQFQIEYDIFGNPEDKQYLEQCKAIIAKLPSHVRVTFKGELSFHTVPQTLIRYHALFLPTLNENFGHSIVESLMCGCVVVISDQTPWNEVQKHDAGFALPLKSSKPFTQAVEELAGLDQSAFTIRSRAAVEFITQKTDLTSITAQYRDMFHECIRQN